MPPCPALFALKYTISKWVSLCSNNRRTTASFPPLRKRNLSFRLTALVKLEWLESFSSPAFSFRWSIPSLPSSQAIITFPTLNFPPAAPLKKYRWEKRVKRKLELEPLCSKKTTPSPPPSSKLSLSSRFILRGARGKKSLKLLKFPAFSAGIFLPGAQPLETIEHSVGGSGRWFRCVAPKCPARRQTANKFRFPRLNHCSRKLFSNLPRRTEHALFPGKMRWRFSAVHNRSLLLTELQRFSFRAVACFWRKMVYVLFGGIFLGNRFLVRSFQKDVTNSLKKLIKIHPI